MLDYVYIVNFLLLHLIIIIIKLEWPVLGELSLSLFLLLL